MAFFPGGTSGNDDRADIMFRTGQDSIVDDFTDNALDAGSGTVRGRAVVANPGGFLTPGMFGNMRLAAGPARQALLVLGSDIPAELPNWLEFNLWTFEHWQAVRAQPADLAQGEPGAGHDQRQRRAELHGQGDGGEKGEQSLLPVQRGTGLGPGGAEEVLAHAVHGDLAPQQRGPLVERERAADHRGVTAEAPAPQAIAEQSHAIGAGGLVGGDGHVLVAGAGRGRRPDGHAQRYRPFH